MKLFIWENVLSDYTDGIMFAFSETEFEARELIKNKFKKQFKDSLDYNWQYKNIQKELGAKPRIIDSPEGFFLYGGS